MGGIAHRSKSWPSSKAFDYAELITANKGDSFRDLRDHPCALGIIRHSAQRRAYTSHRTRSVPGSGALPDARTIFEPLNAKKLERPAASNEPGIDYTPQCPGILTWWSHVLV